MVDQFSNLSLFATSPGHSSSVTPGGGGHRGEANVIVPAVFLLQRSDFEMLLTRLRAIVGMYVVPILTWVGVFFNCASIGFLRTNEVRMRKSLVHLFIFLNVFDS